MPRHSILGTTYGWDNPDGEYQILLDAQVSNLRIRHVRAKQDECLNGYRDHIELLGHIGPDSTAAVAMLLPKLTLCEFSRNQHYYPTIFLASGGGYLSDGFALGELFSEFGVQTMITGGQTCASSCAIAFLGGKYRTMHHDAKLLFHAPYLRSGLAIDCSDRGQVDLLSNYYNKVLGVKTGKFLLNRTLDYCSASSGWTLNSDGAKLFGITTN